MANYYCDHGSYATQLGAAPTWGVPQEGDGSSLSASTAASVGSVLLNAQPPTGALLSICGITFGATSGGTVNYAIGATVTATIDNIVAAVNGCVTAVATGVALGVPQLRNLVFARNTAGTTLDLMCRVGSATLNNANNANVLLTQSGWTTAPTFTQFAGGAGGCWGWLMNPAAIGVGSSYAALAYGLMVASLPLVSVSSASLVTAATPTISDSVYVRTGGGQTITTVVNTYPNIGAPSFPHQLIFDSNMVWTGDIGTGQITVSLSTTNSDISLWLVPSTAGQTKAIRCIKKGGLRFLWTTTSSVASMYLRGYSASGGRAAALIDGVVFEEAIGSNSGGKILAYFAGSYCGLRLKNCSFKQPVARATWAGIASGSIDGALIFEACDIINNHTSGADPGPVSGISASPPSALKFIGCSFSGWSFGKYRLSGPQVFGSGCEIVAEGCTGLTLGSYFNISAATLANPTSIVATYVSADAGLGFRYEYLAAVVDWNPDAAPAYPTRSALLMDTTTPWSIKVDWFAATVTVFSNLQTPRMSSMVRLSAAARTVALDFLSPVTLSARDVAMRAHYIGTDGMAYAESTWAVPSSLTQPGASWAGSSNYPSHVSNRLTLTTSRSVKQNTEVAVYFEATGAPPGGVGIQLYIDPEVGIT